MAPTIVHHGPRDLKIAGSVAEKIGLDDINAGSVTYHGAKPTKAVDGMKSAFSGNSSSSGGDSDGSDKENKAQVVDPLFLPNGERCAIGTVDEEEMYKEYLEETSVLAKKALAFYNRRRGKNPVYVLLKPMLCFVCPSIFCNHFNFLARPKKASSASTPQLFFAEFYFKKQPTFTCVCPLPINLADASVAAVSRDSISGISYDCAHCPDTKFRIYHALDGYKWGRDISCLDDDDY